MPHQPNASVLLVGSCTAHTIVNSNCKSLFIPITNSTHTQSPMKNSCCKPANRQAGGGIAVNSQLACSQSQKRRIRTRALNQVDTKKFFVLNHARASKQKEIYIFNLSTSLLSGFGSILWCDVLFALEGFLLCTTQYW